MKRIATLGVILLHLLTRTTDAQTPLHRPLELPLSPLVEGAGGASVALLFGENVQAHNPALLVNLFRIPDVPRFVLRTEASTSAIQLARLIRDELLPLARRNASDIAPEEIIRLSEKIGRLGYPPNTASILIAPTGHLKHYNFSRNTFTTHAGIYMLAWGNAELQPWSTGPGIPEIQLVGSLDFAIHHTLTYTRARWPVVFGIRNTVMLRIGYLLQGSLETIDPKKDLIEIDNRSSVIDLGMLWRIVFPETGSLFLGISESGLLLFNIVRTTPGTLPNARTLSRPTKGFRIGASFYFYKKLIPTPTIEYSTIEGGETLLSRLKMGLIFLPTGPLSLSVGLRGGHPTAGFQLQIGTLRLSGAYITYENGPKPGIAPQPRFIASLSINP